MFITGRTVIARINTFLHSHRYVLADCFDRNHSRGILPVYITVPKHDNFLLAGGLHLQPMVKPEGRGALLSQATAEVLGDVD